MSSSYNHPNQNGEPALTGQGTEIDALVSSGNSGGSMTNSEGAPAVLEKPGRIWAFALAAALVAPMAGWVAGSAAESYLHWDGRIPAGAAGGRGRRDPGIPRELARWRGNAEKMNTALAIGILGGALGLIFGTAGGLYRRSTSRAAASGALGLMCGTAVGAAVPLLIVPWFYLNEGRPPNQSLPLFFHGVINSAVGAMGGFAFGLGSRGWKGAARATLAAALGAVLGSVVYDVFQIVAFPLVWDFTPMPGIAGYRLPAHLIMSVCAMFCAVDVLRGRHADRAQPAAVPSSSRPESTLSKP